MLPTAPAYTSDASACVTPRPTSALLAIVTVTNFVRNFTLPRLRMVGPYLRAWPYRLQDDGSHESCRRTLSECVAVRHASLGRHGRGRRYGSTSRSAQSPTRLASPPSSQPLHECG